MSDEPLTEAVVESMRESYLFANVADRDESNGDRSVDTQG